MKSKFMRKIVGIEYFRVRCKVGQGTARLTLECGHTKYKKRSEVALGQKRVKCNLCESWSSEFPPIAAVTDEKGTGKKKEIGE